MSNTGGDIQIVKDKTTNKPVALVVDGFRFEPENVVYLSNFDFKERISLGEMDTLENGTKKLTQKVGEHTLEQIYYPFKLLDTFDVLKGRIKIQSLASYTSRKFYVYIDNIRSYTNGVLLTAENERIIRLVEEDIKILTKMIKKINQLKEQYDELTDSQILEIMKENENNDE